MATFGFIGLGNMGAPMAANLVKAQHHVSGYDVVAGAGAALAEKGGHIDRLEAYTNINLKHVVELVNALDTSIDTVSTMKIFKLKNADPYEMAALLTNLYSAPATNQNQAGRGGQAHGPLR